MSCQYENPSGARFCQECGTRLTLGCMNCGAALPTAAKFCPECGTPAASASRERDLRVYTPKHLADKILTQKSALEGERKQVTVLFADVKGSMELAEQVDPEEWHALLDRFFQILTEGVHRFEGTVNQYTGDGIMALFGAPIAHEDHAQRACYAALHLSDELRSYANELRRSKGFNFSIRMGLNSGEVVVGKIGDDLRMDYTAQGHTVGLAARMEQLAEPGKVYLTEHSAALVSGYFELEDLGPFKLQGARAPVRVWELRGVGLLRTRLDVSRTRGFSRFVGRADEMATLESALARAMATGGQILGVVGEAGVGKSRICAEFLDRCRAKRVTIYQTHGVAHGKAIPFLPMLQLFRAFFGIRDQDGDATAREKIAGRLLLLDERFREGLPLMFDFLGVPDPKRPALPMEPEARQRQLLELAKGVIEARGQRETTVSLLEDLHWFDPGSELFLEQLIEALAATRTLMLLNFRPEYHATWMRKSYYQQLPLLPLGPEAIVELIRHLLGADPSLAGVAELVRERSGGNPFFIEEVVQSLAESGYLEGTKGAYRLVRPLEQVAVPPTVQAILAGRIDRLPEREKQVLQTAAVIGRQFSEPILARVIELPETELVASLSELQRAEFIYEEALYPVAEYAFKHTLTRDVALGSQLQERRRRIHAAVAQAIEKANPNTLDEKSALLAHHWEEAGEALSAARWQRRAALWAGMSHGDESTRHWLKVRALLDSIPASQETAGLGVEARAQILITGVRTGLPTEDADALLAEGKELAQRSGDPADRARLLLGYGTFGIYTGRIADAKAPLLEASQQADQTDDLDLALATRYFRLITGFFVGNLKHSIELADETLRLAAQDPRRPNHFIGYASIPAVTALRASLLSEMGVFAEARQDSERAVSLAGEYEDSGSLAMAHIFAARAAVGMGDAAEALTHGRRGVEIAERLGTPNMVGLAYTFFGAALLLSDRLEEAAQAFESVSTRGLSFQSDISQPYIARTQLRRGNASGARATAEEAVGLTRQRGVIIQESESQLALAEVLLATEGARSRGAVETALARTAEIVDEINLHSRQPWIHVWRAELARLLGEDAAHTRELREAHRLFSEMGATGHAERLARELGGDA
ncbi:MAG: AAA family ATPase [Deltaproteobacteria bacterium]|nr:AAA family ATPase [Deltaproteobacteria bacterium]